MHGTTLMRSLLREPAVSELISRHACAGMLTNLGSLPLERIHNMLKMFVVDPATKYDKSEQQLQVFLMQLVEQGVLEYNNSQFKLPS